MARLLRAFSADRHCTQLPWRDAAHYTFPNILVRECVVNK